MKKMRILIADDHAVLRAGLRALLSSQSDMEVVGEAGDAKEATRLTRQLSPDILILDITMPGSSSLGVLERLHQECPQTRVLVLTMHDDPAYLRAALAAGAFGYVVKKAAGPELLAALRAVFEGRAFVDLDLAGSKVQTVLGNQSGEGRGGGPTSQLSSREREVLELLAQGHTNQAIADRLFLSVKTIESYRARLKEKLGLRTRADLIRYAVEIGLLGPDKSSTRREDTT